MTKEERGILYNRIYAEFIDLLNGKINEVVVSQNELYELSKTNYWIDTDGKIIYGICRNTTYANVLQQTFGDKVTQEQDINGNFIYKLDNYYERQKIMKYLYEYKEKDGVKVGGHNLEKIEFTENYIRLLGTEFNGESWATILDMSKIEYLKITPMENDYE